MSLAEVHYGMILAVGGVGMGREGRRGGEEAKKGRRNGRQGRELSPSSLHHLYVFNIWPSNIPRR